MRPQLNDDTEDLAQQLSASVRDQRSNEGKMLRKALDWADAVGRIYLLLAGVVGILFSGGIFVYSMRWELTRLEGDVRINQEAIAANLKAITQLQIDMERKETRK